MDGLVGLQPCSDGGGGMGGSIHPSSEDPRYIFTRVTLISVFKSETFCSEFKA